MASKPTQETLKQSLLDAVKQSVDVNKGICVAYSGGLDSTVLLHLATLLKSQNPSLNITALHVNHGISSSADDWCKHCQEQADMRDIPLHLARLKLQKRPQQSLEADARDARYSALSQFAKDEYIVLLAQHQDDQAETFLLQLKRGAGVKGLSAMPKNHFNKQGTQFVRPLIGFSRQLLLQFAESESLRWIEDESNQDQSFDRNFIRQSIMPQLAARWPQFSATVARSATHCASTQTVVDEYMQLIAQHTLINPKTLNISLFKAYSLLTQKEFLRYWLSNYEDYSPSSAKLTMLTDMLANNANPTAHIQLNKVIVEKSRNTLLIVNSPEERTRSIVLDWQGEPTLAITKSLHIQRTQQVQQNCFWLPFGQFTVQFGSTHYKAKMHAKRPSKALKVWYQEWSVSTLQRRIIPVIISQDEVVALHLLEPSTTKIAHQYSVNDETSSKRLLEGCWAQFVIAD